MPSPSLPAQLIDDFRKGHAAVFVGAGASLASGLPSWQGLVTELAPTLELTGDLPNGLFSPQLLLNVPQFYENRLGRRDLQNKIESLFSNKRPSRIHELIAELPTELFYTTNFDELLEDALRLCDRGSPAVIADEGDARDRVDYRGVQVRKLHGTLSSPRTLVLTRRDYATFSRESSLMLDALRRHLAEHAFLFVGYSLADPDFRAVFNEVLLMMGRMHQRHYMTVTDISDLEREDLRKQGLEAVDLSAWGTGNDMTESLTRFLEALTAHTSDLSHIRRFFTSLRRGDEVPIVVSSRTHEHEQYVYIPECDLHVANQIEQALSGVGAITRRIADRRALRDHELLSTHDLALVCSPFGNRVTREAYARLSDLGIDAQVTFQDQHGERGLRLAGDGRSFQADNPVQAGDAEEGYREHALIARYPNPWNPERHVFVFAGLYALGTHAVGTFLSDLSNYQRLPDAADPLEVILSVRYGDHDPYDYRYSIEDVILANE
jgi:hypothetical protein